MGVEVALLALAGAQVASTIASSYTQSRAIKAQGAYESQIAESNARLAGLQSEDALARGEQEARNYQINLKKLQGTQRASLAAQGLDLGYGSAADVLSDTAYLGAMDVLTIRNNAFRESWGYDIQASEYRSQAGFAQTTAKFRSAQTILTGGMQLATMGTQFYALSQSAPKTLPRSTAPVYNPIRTT